MPVEMNIDRRSFLAGVAALSGGTALSGVAAGRSRAAQKSGGKEPNMKVGLYSITYLGVWYRGEALTLPEFFKRAKKYGYDGVEIDGKRPHGNPLDWPKKRCQELRALANDMGLEIYAVAANNDFSSPIPEFREAQIAYVKELLRMTADLGVGIVRMFLAWPGVTLHPRLGKYSISRGLWQTTHKEFSEEETWDWCRQGMTESAKYAADSGVALALQNHAPVINDHLDVLRMVREVDSPNLKVCLDVPIMKDKRPDSIRKAARDVGGLQVLSHFGGEYKREPDGSVHGEPFYPIFIDAMKEIGYSGYMSYELCHPLPVVEGETVGIEYADLCAELACEYMRGLIKG